MDALVTAGGIPKEDDPLYVYTQGKSKALADMAGKPMAQWVLDALSGSKEVGNVVIVGLDESSGLTCKKPTYYLPNHGGMIDNIRAGTEKILEVNPEAGLFLIVSSDIPTITPEMVDWVVTNARQTDHSLYYHVVPKADMERRFPGSNRTYTKLKGIEVCGGDMNVAATWTVTAQEGLWTKLEDTRKNPLKQAAMVGFDTLFLVLFRLVTVEQAVRAQSAR